ncbi:MAG: AAA domain-containing protein [Saprospiraceae bacterium]|nr:AAA domain-containing protein [Saprospiraceae bacterium]
MENDRYKKMLIAIEKERLAEEIYYSEISKQKTEKEKIEAGIMLASLVLEKKYYTIGEYVEIKLEQTKNFDRPNKFKVGASVHLILQGEETYRFRGTLSYKRKKNFGVIIQFDVISRDTLPDNGNYKLELVYDERPYKVMKKAVVDVIGTKSPQITDLREGIRVLSKLDDRHRGFNMDWKIPGHLNEHQTLAIRGILEASQMGIIHGPPGTGKTTTLSALVKSILIHEKRILVCAPSNNAVDLLAKKISELGVKVVRIGNVTRINEDVAALTLDELARNHPDWSHIKQIRIEAEAARKMAATRKRKFGTDERRHRTDMYKEARELKKWAKDLQKRLLSSILSECQVVATTLIGVSHSYLEDMLFDTVIIDEASQCMEPECWNAMLRAKRVIFAGDHHQLPPTVKSKEAEELGLAETLLSRMTDHIAHQYLLTLQYRMNDDILKFSNQKFYKGLLNSADANKNHRLKNNDHPLVFIDTSGCGYEETFEPKSRSIFNEGEFFIVREHLLLNLLLYEGVEIGLICPYAQQVRYIREKVATDDELQPLKLEINSIDGFQGQEKDVIIISLTRSNEMGIIGFLSDYRRLNVAMTRAKKKLVIIGDGATLSSNPLYLDLINHIEKEGHLQSAWEYMM